MQDYFTDKGKTDILRSTRTGLWEIILRQGREPVMHADSVMLELLGLDAAPEPEECYQVWYNRIQDEYKGAVQETVSKAIASTRAWLLYTSDAADDLLCGDLRGRRFIKKKKKMICRSYNGRALENRRRRPLIVTARSGKHEERRY